MIDEVMYIMINKHEHIGVGAYSNDTAHARWKLSGWQNDILEGTGGDRKLSEERGDLQLLALLPHIFVRCHDRHLHFPAT